MKHAGVCTCELCGMLKDAPAAVASVVREEPHVTLVVKLPRAFANACSVDGQDLTDTVQSMIVQHPFFTQVARENEEVRRVLVKIADGIVASMVSKLKQG